MNAYKIVQGNQEKSINFGGFFRYMFDFDYVMMTFCAIFLFATLNKEELGNNVDELPLCFLGFNIHILIIFWNVN